MIFGIPREIRANENRVGAMPFLVKELIKRGHDVIVETGAGEDSDTPDSQYESVGAHIVPSAEKLYSTAEIVLKVREPKPVEYELIRPDQSIFCFSHFLNHPELVRAIASRGCSCLAYELIETAQKTFPVTEPLGSISGQMAVINGANLLQKNHHGRGVILGKIPGARASRVLIIGGGNVGSAAAKTAANLGACVTVLDIDYKKLRNIDNLDYPNISALMSTDDTIRRLLPETDLVITATQINRQPTAKLISPEMIRTMRKGSVIVVVDIDHGGSVETAKVTDLDKPSFIVEDIIHYCVSNISSAVPMVASQALSSSLLPYLVNIAENGLEGALKADESLQKGIAVYKGHVTQKYLGQAAGLPNVDLLEKIESLNSDN